MLSKFAEATPRNFSPKLTPELSDEARKAVNAAFEAMSTWRTETVDSFEIVIDKMAAAARALGWPQPIVDATHAQMQGVIKMQIQTTDRMMDAWEEQIKSPSSSSAILSKLQSISSFGPAGGWPSAAGAQMAAFNPFATYMQMAQQWRHGRTRWAFGPMPTNQSTGALNCDARDYYSSLVGLHTHQGGKYG